MGARGYCQKSVSEPRTLAFWRDLLAECVASFMLMAVQSSVALRWKPSEDTPHPTDTGIALQIAMAMGFIVTTMAWTFGDFGGAHMNPAVTFAMLLSGNVGFIRGILYMGIQCAGCICGAFFVYAVTPEMYRQTLAATELGSGMEGWQGFLVELWITAILVFTVFGSTNLKRKGNLFMFSIPIGMAVALGIMTAMGHTGGSMNPARSLGPAVVMGIWENHWVYWAGPMAGALLATIFYVSMFDQVDKPKDDDSAETAKQVEADNEMVVRI